MYLNKDYNDYQEIKITDKDLIKDFIDKHINIWEEDILKFENFKDMLKIDNIKSLDIYSYINIMEEIKYMFIFNDNSVKNFYLDTQLIFNWLVNQNLIK